MIFFFYFNHFSFIIFYHSVRLGFEQFRLRLMVHSIGYSLRSRTKDMTITIVIKTPDRKWGWSFDDVMPRRDWLRIWNILKKIQLRSDSVEKFGSDHGVEKLKSDHAAEDSRLDHAGRQLSLPLGHRELSFYLCGDGKIFWSRPMEMNWDLKHHEMYRTLGVELA